MALLWLRIYASVTLAKMQSSFAPALSHFLPSVVPARRNTFSVQACTFQSLFKLGKKQ